MPPTWEQVRNEFDVDWSLIQMGLFVLAPHSRRVQAEIEKHQRALNGSPTEYRDKNQDRLEGEVGEAAARHFGVPANVIAFTDCTTTGLGLLYGGIRIEPGQTILNTQNGHFASDWALKLREARGDIEKVPPDIPLYDGDDPASATEDMILTRLRDAIRKHERPRLLVLTWVHSENGIKLPLARIASEVVEEFNRDRDEADRLLTSVDGVHGVGVEATQMPALGCDFLITGCHKWLFGPRGTGVIVGRSTETWTVARPIVPAFKLEQDGYKWAKNESPGPTTAQTMTPGGFHDFEHRWALAAAFAYHDEIGPARIQQRTHELNGRLKEGLSQIPRVRLLTPAGSHLSAGLTVFEIKGMDTATVIKGLRQRNIVATVTPYNPRRPRLGPTILNNEDEVERAIRAVAELSAAA